MKSIMIPRKPGRPKKKIKSNNTVIPILGIGIKPTDEKLFMELVYDKPINFKKIFQFFKSLASDIIYIFFKKQEINIYTIDHLESNKIMIKINCQLINFYYIEEEYIICVDNKCLYNIFNKCDKQYNNLKLKLHKDNKQSFLFIMLTYDNYINEKHRVDLIGDYDRSLIKNIENNLNLNYSNVDINFKLSGRYLKKMISDIKCISDEITITKDFNQSLKFEYLSNCKKINSQNIIINEKNINLESNIKEMFRLSFKIDYIKPLSSSFLTENIYFYLKEYLPIYIKIKLDNGIFLINILLKIVIKK